MKQNMMIFAMVIGCGIGANAATPVQPDNNPQPVPYEQTVKKMPYMSDDGRVVRNFDISKIDMASAADPMQQVSYFVRPSVVQYKSAPFKAKDGKTYTMYYVDPGKELAKSSKVVTCIYFVPSDYTPVGGGGNSRERNMPPMMYGLCVHNNGAREELGVLCDRKDDYWGFQQGEIGLPDNIANELFDLVNNENPSLKFKGILKPENLQETTSMVYKPFK